MKQSEEVSDELFRLMSPRPEPVQQESLEDVGCMEKLQLDNGCIRMSDLELELDITEARSEHAYCRRR